MSEPDPARGDGMLAPGWAHSGLAAVLRTALDAVVVMDHEGLVVGWSDCAEKYFGWSAGQALGRRMSEIIIPERHRAAHEAGLARYLATGEGPVLDRHIEIEALHRDGHELPVELSITPTADFGAPVFLGFLRDITERKAAEQRQQALVGELDHRVKNLLGVIGALAEQTGRASADLPAFLAAFSGRIAALGHSHELLTRESWQGGSLHDLVAALLGREPDPRISVAGEAVYLGPRQVLGLGMILHELLTNALKYGALAHDGRIEVAWRREADEVAFEWRERGLDALTAPAATGFGTRMIAMTVRHELRGALNSEWLADGLRMEIRFPLGEAAP